MNDYDDSQDYSSSNSFRARSNTWPLNRLDSVVPNVVCVDETLPEIELEDDDLFTTNENWTSGLVDHDIMSWDPILNAQSTQHHQQVTTSPDNQQQQQPQHQIQATTVHHQPQPHQHHHHQPPPPHHQHHHHHHHHHLQQPPPPPPPQTTQQQQPTHHHQQIQHHQAHHRQPSIHQHPHHHSPQPDNTQHQHHHQNLHPQQHDALLGGSPIMITSGQVQHHQQPHPQQQIQIQPTPTQQPSTHLHTPDNSHCLDVEDPNEYHLEQLHHLHLDNNHTEHQTPYVSSLSSICVQGTTANLAADSYNISPDHQHLLQPLTSARYDIDQHCDLDFKPHNEPIHIDHHHHHQQPHHQLHQLTSTSLDNHSTNSPMLSSSLSTSGICLNSDLEDLDYKAVDPSSILQAPLQYEDQQLDQQHQSRQKSEGGGKDVKQSSSTTSSKTKLNTPRRNAWGNMSYADLISQAIDSTDDKRLTLSQIYDWMVQHVPYFKDKGDSNSSAGWKNSVRHNLSLHSRFKRLQNEGTGKSSWWTINPEATVGKCARRRAASMEASKFEKKRGRAKKRAEAIRQGLVSYPSLTNSSLNGSNNNLDQPQSHTINQLLSGPQQQQHFDSEQLQQPMQQQPQQQPQSINQFDSQQQSQLQQLQPINQFEPKQHQQTTTDGSSADSSHNRQPNTGLYVATPLKSQYELDPRYTIVMSK